MERYLDQILFGTNIFWYAREKPGRKGKAEQESQEAKQNKILGAQLVNLILTHRRSSFRPSHFSSTR